MDNKRIGIVMDGTCKQLNDFWLEWLNETKNLILLAGYTPTHIGVQCDSMNDGKIKTISRSEKRIRELISSGENFDSISVFSLNKGFHSAFDSEIWLTLDKSYSYIYCELPFEKYKSPLSEKLHKRLLDFIDLEQGEVFAMDKEETPFNYVMNRKKGNVNRYSTLKILSTNVLEPVINTQICL